jgi:RNA polymerase sigma factor (sigma-70 family)
MTTWIYRIAKNECATAIAKKATERNRYLPDETGVLARSHKPSPPPISKRALYREIRTALSEMPKSWRQAFELFYFKGYSGLEAARKMKITRSNYFMRLKSARDLVRERLQQAGVANFDAEGDEKRLVLRSRSETSIIDDLSQQLD